MNNKPTVVEYGFGNVSVGHLKATEGYPYPSFWLLPLTQEELETNEFRKETIEGDVAIVFADNQAIRDLISELNDLLTDNADGN